MKTFAHFNAKTIDEAVSLLRRYRGKAALIAGGTDLLGKMKDRILPGYPEALINLKTIPGMDGIIVEEGLLRIGALARLEDIAHHPIVRDRFRALATAARRTASPHLREMGTIAGNLCQDIRCWYYRQPNNLFPCLRKGGGRCYAIEGDHRYHSIFGGSVDGGCYAVHPSDTAPALTVLGSKIKTSKRVIPIERFFSVDVSKTTVLEPDEIVTEIEIPMPPAQARSHFQKFAMRKSIDFPIVNCAAMLAFRGEEVAFAKISLNAVHVNPYRAVKAEEILQGNSVDEALAESCAEAAISDAKPLQHNAYMVFVAKALIKRAVLACKGEGLLS